MINKMPMKMLNEIHIFYKAIQMEYWKINLVNQKLSLKFQNMIIPTQTLNYYRLLKDLLYKVH